MIYEEFRRQANAADCADGSTVYFRLHGTLVEVDAVEVDDAGDLILTETDCFGLDSHAFTRVNSHYPLTPPQDPPIGRT